MFIEINNSFSKLVGFPPELVKKVRDVLSYTDQEIVFQKQNLYRLMQTFKARGNIAYLATLKKQFRELGSEHVCLLSEDNSFPTGLIHLVESSLQRTDYFTKDKRVKPESYNTFRWVNKPHALRYYQREAVDAFIKEGRGVIESAIGTGKSLISTYIIKELGVNSLFIVPSTALLEQMNTVFSLAFGSKNVQMIKTDNIKSNKKLKPIRIVTAQTLHSLNKQGLIHKLLGDIDFVIYDEAHHSASETQMSLLPGMSNVYYRLSMTGTYTRNDSKKLELWGACGKVLYKYDAKQATKEGYLTPVEFNIVPLAGTYNHNYQKEYKENYSSDDFISKVADLVKNQIPKNKQVLILIDRKETVGNLIHEKLNELKIKNTYMTGDNSRDDIKQSIEDFNDKKIQVLIGSTIFGEGVDLISTDHLIMARGGKSEIAMTQAVGRAVRLFEGKKLATVWDFNFKFSKYLTKHLNERIDIYEKQFAGKVNYL